MRAFMLMKERPKDRDGMRTLLLKCRRADGGFGVTPESPSSMAGTYFAFTIEKWLGDE